MLTYISVSIVLAVVMIGIVVIFRPKDKSYNYVNLILFTFAVWLQGTIPWIRTDNPYISIAKAFILIGSIFVANKYKSYYYEEQIYNDEDKSLLLENNF